MQLKLFMVLLGCRPKGRHTEQHDIYFGIAKEWKELIPEFKAFWPEAKGKMHVDGWREVTQVNGQSVKVIERTEKKNDSDHQLYFINLGGYKENEFEEFHYKMVVAAPNKSAAISVSKKTAFFKHTHFDGANSHVDDKYGIDVDDMYEIDEMLTKSTKEKYAIEITLSQSDYEDVLNLGYFKF
jgi:hypothetical protein